MPPSFNRIARPDEFAGQEYKNFHRLVTSEVMQNQHPVRSWEYSQALDALEHSGWDFNEERQLLFADVGGAGSRFWTALTRYTTLPITGIDPNHEVPNGQSIAFRQTIREYLQESPEFTGRYDAVFAISVIEHVPHPEVEQFAQDLISLLKPGGLLFLTTDAIEQQPDTYHFHWMRQRGYAPDNLDALGIWLVHQGLQFLSPPDFVYHGPTVYDYSVASIAMIKPQ